MPVTADSYPFLSTDKDLNKYGYVEEEFFIEGNGYTYDTSGDFETTATRNDGDGTYPFKTRIVVRRPAAAADANGTVVAEWNNVTATQDIEWNWFGDPEFLMDNGYTFVGVTAQNVGVNSLLNFNPTRYAGLSVNGNGTVPTGPGLDSDALSYEVFSSALKAIRGAGTGADPLGGINADTIISSGESQSCGRLATHHNEINPIHEISDAYLLTVCGSSVRTDRPEKVIRVLTETENRSERTPADFPDTSSIRHWEVAGASHLPRMAFDNINGVLTRDFLELTVQCQKFPLSLVEQPFTVNRATDALRKWVNSGEAPPIAPRGQYVPNPDYDPLAPPQNNPETILDRDEFGIAKGGIRYPAMDVPTALNDGSNSSAPGGSLFSAFCGLLGSSTPFSEEQLSSLYTDFADYLGKYDVAADAMIPDGFILPEDVERLKESARQFAEIRPTAPLLVGNAKNKGNFGLTWVGTEAPDTTFEVQRGDSSGSNWTDVSPSVADRTASFSKETQGTFSYRVRNTTILPGTNISEPRTVVTPYSEAVTGVKVDRSGPKKP
ncbi:MAG: alpha/beta hydrolase domain-containing protein, partial [Solirubrobacterales bacterium]